MKNLLFTLILLSILAASCTQSPDPVPIRVVAELDMGESRDITLSNGEVVNLEVIAIAAQRDSLRDAVRRSVVRIKVDGEPVTLGSGNYNLPVETGKVQIDCPVTTAVYTNTNNDHWGLTKDARFRLWPAGSPYMEPGTFVYPIKQEWLASMSQSGNEACYVDWGEDPARKEIYYHAGHDIGGAEGMDEIVSATDGLVLSANSDTLEGYIDFPGDIRPDVVWVLNDLGWYIRYSHLDSTDPSILPGARVKAGQKIGYIGKQGGSGGWVHLHFEIINKETISGDWGTEEAYPYVWESYVKQYKPAMIAIARPHHLLWTGEEAHLDGSKSMSFAGDIVSWQWTFSDGSSAEGAHQQRSYTVPGEYSEILKVSDSRGNIDYDFMVIQVIDRENPGRPIPTLQAAYHPTQNIKTGDQLRFLVRSFNTGEGEEIWDFGDGSPQVPVKSEPVDRQKYTEGKFAETTHSFSDPGNYIVTVERADEHGIKATGHLHVVVSE